MPDLLRESGSRPESRAVLHGLESRRRRRSYSALNGAQSGLEHAFPRDDRISPTDSWKSGPAPPTRWSRSRRRQRAGGLRCGGSEVAVAPPMDGFGRGRHRWQLASSFVPPLLAIRSGPAELRAGEKRTSGFRIPSSHRLQSRRRGALQGMRSDGLPEP